MDNMGSDLSSEVSKTRSGAGWKPKGIPEQLEKLYGEVFQLMDREMASGSWKNYDDCLVYCYVTAMAPPGPFTAEQMAEVLPKLRELYRLHRFCRYGYLEHRPNDFSDCMPMYYCKEW